jgi:hypothetical protein
VDRRRGNYSTKEILRIQGHSSPFNAAAGCEHATPGANAPMANVFAPSELNSLTFSGLVAASSVFENRFSFDCVTGSYSNRWLVMALKVVVHAASQPG